MLHRQKSVKHSRLHRHPRSKLSFIVLYDKASGTGYFPSAINLNFSREEQISRHIFTSVTNLTSRPRDSEEDATAFSPIEMISTNSDLAREMYESVSCAFSTGGFEMASQLLFTRYLRYLKRIPSQDAGWLLVQRAAHFPSAVTATDAASLSSFITKQLVY